MGLMDAHGIDKIVGHFYNRELMSPPPFFYKTETPHDFRMGYSRFNEIGGPELTKMDGRKAVGCWIPTIHNYVGFQILHPMMSFRL